MKGMMIAGIVVLSVVAVVAFGRALDVIDPGASTFTSDEVFIHARPSRDVLEADRRQARMMYKIGIAASFLDLLLIVKLLRLRSNAKTPA